GGLPLLGELRALPDLADEIQVREVVVGKDVLQSQSTLEQLVACRNLGIKVTPAAQLYEELTGQVPLSQIDHYWIMDLPNRALLNRPYTALKRLVDIVLSLLGLVVLVVLGPLVALAILIDSGRAPAGAAAAHRRAGEVDPLLPDAAGGQARADRLGPGQ